MQIVMIFSIQQDKREHMNKLGLSIFTIMVIVITTIRVVINIQYTHLLSSLVTNDTQLAI